MLNKIQYNPERLKGLKEHHTAFTPGYVSKKVPGVMYEYRGHFGTGIAVKTHCKMSTQYCYVTYYVEE